MEVDYIIPSSKSSKDVYSNLQFLRKYCHILKTRKDNVFKKKLSNNLEDCENANIISFRQEPDEVKISCLDLSTGAKVTRPLV